MADRTVSDSRRYLSVTTPHSISKDALGSGNPIPLSPQWLLPKPGENKPVIGSAETQWNSNPNNDIGPETRKVQGFGQETHDTQKKDVFRPSSLDMESGGRRDRWGDEERDTNSSIRKDRRFDGDNELGDTRKVDRWTDNQSTRQFGEARRTTTERRTDLSNRETNHEQRRDTKWNTNWGPKEKEKESSREKWVDSSRERDMPSDKGLSHLNSIGKDETVGDHYRPWRSSSSQNRGRGEPPHQQNLTPNKHGPMFSYGRGRGENSPPIFSHGRGRVNSSGSSVNNCSPHLLSLGTTSDKSETIYGDTSLLRYSRTKLLDVYRTTDIRSGLELLDGFVQVSSLTQEELLEPMALSAQTMEESVILKGIVDGDIVSSDAPQISKDGSAGRNAFDIVHSRRPKLGSREDLAAVADQWQDEGSGNLKRGYSNNSESSLPEASHSDLKMEAFQKKPMRVNSEVLTEDNTPNRKAYEVPAKRESSIQGNSSPWRPPSSAERSHDVRSSSSETSRLQSQKYSNEWQGTLPNSSHATSDLKWHGHGNEDPVNKRLPPGISNREHESRKIVPPSPEDLVLYYKDPQGEVQGPFSGSDVIGWFEAGYFGIDLQAVIASELNKSPFKALGDVMPHLRAKSGPPPGFKSPKQSDIIDAPIRPSFGSYGKLHGDPSEVDILKNEPSHIHGSAKEAENRFLESLMSGNINVPLENFALSEGLQGYMGNNSSIVPPVGIESENSLYLLAKKMELERQKALLSRYPYQQAQMQNAALNNNVNSWSNFPVQGGLESFQDKVGLYHGQNSPLSAAFGIQQQRLQQQNQSPLTNLLGQLMDNSAGGLTTEKLLSSGLPQDPQLLNMLQQQYLLQLQAQTSVPTQQLSVLDKLLLLKQQQEQQQQAILQQQLSQVLSEHHSSQRFGEPSYGQLPATAVPAGNASIEHHRLPPAQELFHTGSSTGSNMVVSDMQDDHMTDFPSLSPQVSKDINRIEATSLHLPHQMFGSEPSKKSFGTVVVPEQPTINQHTESLPLSTNDASRSLEVRDRPAFDITPVREFEATSKSQMTLNAIPSGETCEDNLFTPQLATDMKIKLDGSSEEQYPGMCRATDEPSMTMSLENVEVHEVKRASDKKSRKQKTSKAKDVSKTPQQKKQSKIEDTNVENSAFEAQTGTGEANYGTSPKDAVDINFGIPTTQSFDSQLPKSSLPVNLSGDGVQFMDNKGVSGGAESASQFEKQGQTAQRAWKPAPGFKAKSLLEIQQEEQRKAQMEATVFENTSSSNPVTVSVPWAGVVSKSDSKSARGISQDEGVADLVWGMSSTSLHSVSKKSQLHDLLAEEVLEKSNEKNTEVLDKTFSVPPESVAVTHLDSIENGNFTEAKDTKKNRKKAAKAKSGAKVPFPVGSVEMTLGTSPSDKGKSTRHGQLEKEVLPAVPSGPSLGDFVFWKGGESANTAPAPAWLNDSGKLPKPTSLRDILKEQGKKSSSVQHPSQLVTPQKSQPIPATRGNGTSLSLHGSSPSKAATPIQNTTYKGDDDLFWGTIDQQKPEAKQSDFPQLASQSSWGSKKIPVKGTPGGASSRQKSVTGRPAEYSLSSSPVSVQSSLKGKRDVAAKHSDAVTKHAEATDFRDWCASETVRLTGTKDTSFLEFCLKQTRSEAEILLKENLGSFDPNHEFIDKFLNYKELLPADVLEIAFQNQADGKVAGFGASNFADLDQTTAVGTNDSTKGGGKKKGKKGKKVSPSVLGFSVVSNRIMMGEIQTLDD